MRDMLSGFSGDVFVFFLTVFIVVTVVSLAVVEDHKVELSRELCIKEHGGKPFINETVIGETSDGCIIKRVDPFNANCMQGFPVYVTNCAGIAWPEKHGKQTAERANVTN